MNTIKSLLNEDSQEILNEQALWPKSMLDVLDVCDRELSDVIDLKPMLRPLIYLILSSEGGLFSVICRQPDARRFCNEKRIYDLYKVDSKLAKEAYQNHRKSLLGTSFDQVIEQQSAIHGEGDSDLEVRVYTWQTSVVRLCDLMAAALSECELDEFSQHRLKQAVISGVSIMREQGGHFYLPSGERLRARLLAQKVAAEMRSGSSAQVAQMFGLTTVHVLRLAKKENRRQKEKRDRQTGQL